MLPPCVFVFIVIYVALATVVLLRQGSKPLQLQSHSANQTAIQRRAFTPHCAAQVHDRLKRRSSGSDKRGPSLTKHGAEDFKADAALHLHWSRRMDEGSKGCLLTPEVTQGPYHILGERVQQDIRGGQAGVPLRLMLHLVDIEACEPIPHAWVDVWSANSTGKYSGFSSRKGGNSELANMEIVDSATITSYTAGADNKSSLPGMPKGGNRPTDGDNFLRGVWRADDEGVLDMYTIVPGWYSYRAPHVHIKVYESKHGRRAKNGSFVTHGASAHHTGQMFLPRDVMDAVAVTSPYRNNRISWANQTKNTGDFVYPYADSLGSNAELDVTFINSSDVAYGLIASTVVKINMSYTSPELTTFYWDPDV